MTSANPIPAVTPVILSGGSGTRLWPLSRAQYPKQFLPLLDERSLFQDTVVRSQAVPGARPPVVVSNDAQRFLVAEQLLAIGSDHSGILLEPEGRNTAPAIALAALEAAEVDAQSLLLVLPADHRIADKEAFSRAVEAALPVAREGALVTFGVVPDRPETGFGYIRVATEAAGEAAMPVAEFVEKPDAERAQNYLASGDYYWNSGLFLFRADRYLEELDQHAPAILAACREAHAGVERDRDFVRVGAEAFAASPDDEVDPNSWTSREVNG